MSRRIAVAAVVALAAGGIAAGVHFAQPDTGAPATETAPVVDASLDGRAKVTKRKPPSKAPRRGGKTRVTARGSGGAGPRGGADHAGESGEPHGGEGPAGARETHGHTGHGTGHASPAGPSYESALDANRQQVTIGASTGPDLTDAQLSAPMSDGSFVSDCDAPETMDVTVKVAVRMGRAVGVTVATSPPDAPIAHCIDRHVRGIQWPASPKMDSFVTSY